MNGADISITVAALANLISQSCTEDQISLLAVIFTQLGDTLETIQTANSLCNKCNE